MALKEHIGIGQDLKGHFADMDKEETLGWSEVVKRKLRPINYDKAKIEAFKK